MLLGPWTQFARLLGGEEVLSHDRRESGRGGSQIRKHFAPPSCRLDRPRGSYPGPVTRPLSSSSSSTLQPHPGFGVAPVPHTLLTPTHAGTLTHPNCSAASAGARGPRSTASPGPRSPGQPGLRLGAAGSGSRCPPRPRGRTHPCSGAGP